MREKDGILGVGLPIGLADGGLGCAGSSASGGVVSVLRLKMLFLTLSTRFELLTRRTLLFRSLLRENFPREHRTPAPASENTMSGVTPPSPPTRGLCVGVTGASGFVEESGGAGLGPAAPWACARAICSNRAMPLATAIA